MLIEWGGRASRMGKVRGNRPPPRYDLHLIPTTLIAYMQGLAISPLRLVA